MRANHMGIHKQKYKETRIVVRVDLIQADQQVEWQMRHVKVQQQWGREAEQQLHLDERKQIAHRQHPYFYSCLSILLMPSPP